MGKNKEHDRDTNIQIPNKDRALWCVLALLRAEKADLESLCNDVLVNNWFWVNKMFPAKALESDLDNK